MICVMLAMLAFVRADVSNDLYIAIQNQKMGRVNEAQKFFDSNFYQYGTTDLFIEKHIDFLIWIGDFESVIRKYGHLKLDKIKKVHEYLSILNTRDYKQISKLYSVSPYSPIVLKSCIKLSLMEKNYKDIINLINKGLNNFSDDQFLQYEAQYYCLTGNYDLGCHKLESLGFVSVSNTLRRLVNRFSTFEKTLSDQQMFQEIKSMYHQINTLTFSDNFNPSVYSDIFEKVMYKYVKLGVELEQSKLVSIAKLLYNNKKDEESRYFYVLALIYDDQITKAKSIYEAKTFRNSNYSAKITSLIEKHINEERQQQEERRNRGNYGYTPQKTNKAGSDFLGYYKLLGVNKNMTTKQIKKAFVKIIAKESRKKRNDKEQAKWDEMHAKYNAACQVLTDEKKKKQYDDGIDPNSPYVQQERHHQSHNFKGFDDFGPFADFFSGFGGNQGGYRQGRRTQYFYFG